MKGKKLAIFEGKKIRRIWDDDQEKWYFSVVDIVAVLTNQMDFQLARNYWKVLAKNARLALEQKTGRKVVSANNFKALPKTIS